MTKKEEITRAEIRRDWQKITDVFYMLFDLLEIAKKQNKNIVAAAFPRFSSFDYKTNKDGFSIQDVKYCLDMMKNRKWNIINLKNHFIKHYII